MYACLDLLSAITDYFQTFRKEGQTGHLLVISGNELSTINKNTGKVHQFPADTIFKALGQCTRKDFLAERALQPQMLKLMRDRCNLVAPYAEQLKSRVSIDGGESAIVSVFTAAQEMTSVANTATSTTSWTVGSYFVSGLRRLNGILPDVVQTALNIPRVVEYLSQSDFLVGYGKGELLNFPDKALNALLDLTTQIIPDYALEDTMDTMQADITSFTLDVGLANRAALKIMIDKGRELTQRINNMRAKHKRALGIRALDQEFRRDNAITSYLRNNPRLPESEVDLHAMRAVGKELFPPDPASLMNSQVDQAQDNVDNVQRELESTGGVIMLLNGVHNANPDDPAEARKALSDMKTAVDLIENIENWQKYPLLVSQLARVRYYNHRRDTDNQPALLETSLKGLDTPAERDQCVREAVDVDKRTRKMMLQGLVEMNTEKANLLGYDDTQYLLVGREELNIGFDDFATHKQIQGNVRPGASVSSMFVAIFSGGDPKFEPIMRMLEHDPISVAYSDSLAAESVLPEERAKIDENLQFLDPESVTVWETITEDLETNPRAKPNPRPSNGPGEGDLNAEPDIVDAIKDYDSSKARARAAAQGEKSDFAKKAAEQDRPMPETTGPPITLTPWQQEPVTLPGGVLPFPAAVPPADAAPGAVLPLRVHYRLAELDDDDTC